MRLLRAAVLVGACRAAWSTDPRLLVRLFVANHPDRPCVPITGPGLGTPGRPAKAWPATHCVKQTLSREDVAQEGPD